MNNPLAQKAQYYLNESHRLNEELKNEEEYSELLENVLFELLGEEDFTRLFEYVMKGDLTTGEDGKPLSPERSARRAKRIGQIIDIGKRAALADNDHKVFRTADSLVAKNVVDTKNYDKFTGPNWTSNRKHIAAQLRTSAGMRSRHGAHDPNTTFEVRAGQMKPLGEPGGPLSNPDVPAGADERQKNASLERRKAVQQAKMKAAERIAGIRKTTHSGNTFNP